MAGKAGVAPKFHWMLSLAAAVVARDGAKSARAEAEEAPPPEPHAAPAVVKLPFASNLAQSFAPGLPPAYDTKVVVLPWIEAVFTSTPPFPITGRLAVSAPVALVTVPAPLPPPAPETPDSNATNGPTAS